MTALVEIETPAAVVDVDVLDANVSRVTEYCRTHDLGWRPHIKTHKTRALARRCLAAGAAGVTVATPREAEVMAREADDILFAYPPVGEGKLRRLAGLPEGPRLGVALDSAGVARELAAAAREAGRSVGVLVELDVGLHRTGVGGPGEALALAREVASLDGSTYRGLMFYAGHIRMPVVDQGPALAELSGLLRETIDALESEGLGPEVVSGGTSPTLFRSHEVPEVTELRSGMYVFNDRSLAALGACRWEDCAYSVLATVVSTAVPGRAVVDAGSKALSKEEFRGEGRGYGALLERPEVVVRALSEEHGILDLSRTRWRPDVGDRVRVVPNHVCVSVNLHEELVGARDGEVVERWRPEARGRGPYRPDEG